MDEKKGNSLYFELEYFGAGNKYPEDSARNLCGLE